jgi:dsRNA-specific ribonuclease
MNTHANPNMDEDIRVEKNANGVDTYIFDPYNSLNKQIEENDIREILQKYGIDAPIYNIHLYKRAFVHRSYIKRQHLENTQNNVVIVPKPDNCMSLFTKSNERLEFIGDGALECITKYLLYRRFPKANEGFMTEKKIALVKNESIGRIAYEMGLHKWLILSKHAELKQTRTNLKKLGCLFEAFLGALFLDFNKMAVLDEEEWFSKLFICGPGFQMAQVFVENVFEKHVDWIGLIRNDDNYKNILQVIIQKEFKVTPHYLEMEEHHSETGYSMGVFLCLGQAIHETNIREALPFSRFTNYLQIHEFMALNGKLFMFLGEGKHKIKKKAEQIACESAIQNLRAY